VCQGSASSPYAGSPCPVGPRCAALRGGRVRHLGHGQGFRRPVSRRWPMRAEPTNWSALFLLRAARSCLTTGTEHFSRLTISGRRRPQCAETAGRILSAHFQRADTPGRHHSPRREVGRDKRRGRASRSKRQYLRPLAIICQWWAARDSNPGPADQESAARNP